MIRHVVSWKLKATDDAGRADGFATISSTLLALQDTIPEIKAISINQNVVDVGVNFDVVLIADYDSVEALQAYQVHPDHVAAAAIIRQLVEARANVDFVV